MTQYRQPPRLIRTGREARLRRFANSFRPNGDGRAPIVSITNHGTSLVVNSNTTIIAPTQFLFVNTASANTTVTLPSAAAYSGIDVFIKRTDITNSRTITVQGAGGAQIDGVNSVQMVGRRECLTVLSDGTNWNVIDRYRTLPGLPSSVVTTSATPYQMEPHHKFILGSKASGTQVIVVPRALQARGSTIYVKNISSSATVQVQNNPSGGPIDQGIKNLSGLYSYGAWTSDGTTWRQIALGP